MDMISLFCGSTYLETARYSDLQTPYVQTEYDPYLDVLLQGILLDCIYFIGLAITF